MRVVTVIILIALIVSETVSTCHTRCCQICGINNNCCEINSDCCEMNNGGCKTNNEGCETKSTCCQRSNDCCQKYNKSDTVDILTPAPARYTLINRETNEEKNNTNTFAATLNLNNNVTNVNNIHIPITVTSENHQNIEIVSWVRSYAIKDTLVTETPQEFQPTTKTTSVTESSVTTNCWTTSTPETTTTPATTPCQPVPILIPMPMMPVTEAPKPVNPVPGCCTVVHPCLQGLDHCIPYRSVCGGQCTHPFMYQPMNPCEGGCYKRPFGMWNQCDFSRCQRRMVDCRFCQDDFYYSYEGYRQCGGCYYQ